MHASTTRGLKGPQDSSTCPQLCNTDSAMKEVQKHIKHACAGLRRKLLHVNSFSRAKRTCAGLDRSLLHAGSFSCAPGAASGQSL